MSKTKPFSISKKSVIAAWERVKANKPLRAKARSFFWLGIIWPFIVVANVYTFSQPPHSLARCSQQNKGSHGIDEESIQDFESDLKENLYKIWNRMSSGTYFAPPVKAVEIQKSDGRTRLLGIPTVSDRVAQAVVKLHLEPIVDPEFHKDSYGYRPGKSALDAVGVARKRCWRQDWVIDLDIKGFFDNLDHALMMKAVRFHTDEKWIHLYVERWLKAP